MRKKYVIIDYPRLIRLNPNIPWKTRGNGAIAFQVGKKGTHAKKIGEMKNLDFFMMNNSDQDLDIQDIEILKKIIVEVIDTFAEIQGRNTNPGAVILPHQPPYQIYQQAVRSLYTILEIKKILNKYNSEIISYKNARGLIGSTAAIAWRPSHDYTYEIIAYRQKSRWGSQRDINAESVQKIDKKVPSTFDNYDYIHHHNRIAPNSPCPILYGIRGQKPTDLPKAMALVESEEYESWIIYLSNQGTDDHLQKSKISSIAPYSSVIVNGTVATVPAIIRGGHVIFSIKDDTNTIDVAAYEPTKGFRNIIRKLNVGDDVTVYGGVRKEPLTINLEKIFITKLVSITEKIENPICSECGKHMKSIGKNQGFRCRKCRTSSKDPIYHKKSREIESGWYEAPVCARRHLVKPLKLMQK